MPAPMIGLNSCLTMDRSNFSFLKKGYVVLINQFHHLPKGFLFGSFFTLFCAIYYLLNDDCIKISIIFWNSFKQFGFEKLLTFVTLN